MWKTLLIAALMVPASTLVSHQSGSARAQSGPTHWSAPPAKAAGAPKEGGRRARRMKRLRTIRLQVLESEVGLSPQKAAQVGAVMEGFDGLRRGFRRQLREARQELQSLLDADSNDMKKYQAAMKHMRSAHADLQRMRQQQFKAVAKLLTPKQGARLLLAMERINKAVRQRFRGARRGGKHQGPAPTNRRGDSALNPWGR